MPAAAATAATKDWMQPILQKLDADDDTNGAVEMLEETFASEQDKFPCWTILLHKLIEKEAYDDVENIIIAKQHFDVRDCRLRYALVLMEIQRQQNDSAAAAGQSEAREKALVKALQVNTYVPAMLMHGCPPPGSFRYVGPGTASEAADYANVALEFWKKAPGALAWLQQIYQEPKPQDKGVILFDLLQKGRLLVHLYVDDYVSRMEVTTRVDQMMGTACRDFSMPSGMKEHDPAKIMVYRTRNELLKQGSNPRDGMRFVGFDYDSVKLIPFWKVLHAHADLFAEPLWGHMCGYCKQKASLKRCSRCKVKWYCSQDCQKKDWTRRNHKQICPKLIKS